MVSLPTEHGNTEGAGSLLLAGQVALMPSEYILEQVP